MKILKVRCWLLRIPFTFPLVKEQQHALAKFVEIETDEGHKGHARSTYPLKHGIREFINREAAPVLKGSTRCAWRTFASACSGQPHASSSWARGTTPRV